MDTELCAPRFKAIVTENHVTPEAVELQVRYLRKSIVDDKREVFKVLVKCDVVGRQAEAYQAAKQLRPGDELFVDPYGEEWSDPKQRSFIRRRWNLTFA